ncbi:hypothetical protein PGT21_016122 [Puccinia graminis f. sp. tritici]|uniref:Uncharacterized protein n=1 Tax=Puccinia graminis f. sp. tritici TaxID=56615 RepID=A0A5B0LLT8_PUCGR|nr:hypothetical protein PGT21_016122 [Puccinia graminis f. sp. tritici]
MQRHQPPRNDSSHSLIIDRAVDSAVHSPSTATSSTLGNSSPIRPSRSSELASSSTRASLASSSSSNRSNLTPLSSTLSPVTSTSSAGSSLRIISINTIQLLIHTDEIVQVEDRLCCGMAEISELDGPLTPALSEVKLSYQTTNELLSKILDVHSYLCDSLAKAASILSIYRLVLGHLSRAINSLQASLLDHLKPSNPVFPFPQTAAVKLKSVCKNLLLSVERDE